MNPVLLKPQTETGAQIVVQGRMRGAARARDFQAIKAELMPAVLDSFARLKAGADVVLVEGAGSASEINLRANDIANMGFARAAGVPVVLIGDIDRGGVIASLVGTKAVLDPDDAAMIVGFIVNRMRGDPTLFDGGRRAIAEMTGWRDFGLVPFLPDAARLPAEDALSLHQTACRGDGPVRVVALAFPRIANFDDLDPIAQTPGVTLDLIGPATPIPGDAALVVLPGSKATIADLKALREAGWDVDLAAHVRRGGRVLGLCGGYQMLGRSIADPDGIEGPPARVDGLGLIDVETVMTGDKRLSAVSGRLSNGAAFSGYEMHIGRTHGPGTARPFLFLDDGRADGAVSPDGRVAGTYVHGLFAADAARAALLSPLGVGDAGLAYEDGIEAALDALAAHCETHLDVDGLIATAR